MARSKGAIVGFGWRAERIAANWSRPIPSNGLRAFWPEKMPALQSVNAQDPFGGQFSNRREAGRQLARQLSSFAGRDNVIVLGLPRGGVPVAFEVALALGAPLDVIIVRKLGVPGHEELAMGAIAAGGVRVLNREVLRLLPDAEGVLAKVSAIEQCECERREKEYRDGRPALELRGKTVILVDDGFATGATMRAAVAGARIRGAARIVVAAPVGARETCAVLGREADRVLCLIEPPDFFAVGQFFGDFSQTTGEEVRDLLTRAAERQAPNPGAWRPGTVSGEDSSPRGHRPG
jgi:putative phosphoribosyl transferase